jgi:heme-degrading monooxygenase HmoA
VIARLWRGWTRTADAAEYIQYLQQTGMQDYRATPGNRAAFILHRAQGDRTEFVTMSFWDSIEAVRRFAGDQEDRAVFYPADDRFLVDRETTASHFELIEAAPSG